MIRKIRIPGVGEVEIDLVMHPSVKEGDLHVQKISAKFFIVKYREFQDPTDMQIMTAVKRHAWAERQDLEIHSTAQATEREQVREPVIGRIGKEIM
jgi:hypothetical protein